MPAGQTEATVRKQSGQGGSMTNTVEIDYVTRFPFGKPTTWLFKWNGFVVTWKKKQKTLRKLHNFQKHLYRKTFLDAE